MGVTFEDVSAEIEPVQQASDAEATAAPDAAQKSSMLEELAAKLQMLTVRTARTFAD